MYPKLQGYDLKQLKELVKRNGWKNVQLSLDDIRDDISNEAAQQSVQRTDLQARPHKEPCICVACEDYDNGTIARR